MKEKILKLMLKNFSILEISKQLHLSFHIIRKFQTEIMFDNSQPKKIESTLDNIRVMEARAFWLAENYKPVYKFKLDNLLINLEKSRV